VTATVAPASPVPLTLTVPVCAKLPVTGARIVGALGVVLSIVNATVPVVLFVAGSVTVTTGLLPIVFPVPTQITVHDVLGVGEHVVPGIVTTSPDAIPGHVIVTTTFPDVMLGDAVHIAPLGAVASYVTWRVFDGVFGLPA
jgi:hypothetical protein